MGRGYPLQVRAGSVRLLGEFDLEQIAIHLHDTRGLGVTNAFAAYEVGVRNFDGSIGGLGGCPYAPGAAGNLGTEDIVHLFSTAGARTGVDLDELRRTSEWLSSTIGLTIASRYHRYALASLNA